MKTLLISVLVCVGLLISGCSTPQVKPEVSLPKQTLGAKPAKKGHGRVVFYNDSFALGRAQAIAITIAGKRVGELFGLEYLALELPKGKHRVDLMRIDVFTLRGSGVINVVPGQESFVRLRATPVNNLLDSTGKPSDFTDKFASAYLGEGE